MLADPTAQLGLWALSFGSTTCSLNYGNEQTLKNLVPDSASIEVKGKSLTAFNGRRLRPLTCPFSGHTMTGESDSLVVSANLHDNVAWQSKYSHSLTILVLAVCTKLFSFWTYFLFIRAWLKIEHACQVSDPFEWFQFENVTASATNVQKKS